MISLSSTTWGSAQAVTAAVTAPRLDLSKDDSLERRPALVIRRAAPGEGPAPEPGEGPVAGARSGGLDIYL